jgi:hypothetical protein
VGRMLRAFLPASNARSATKAALRELPDRSELLT